MIKFLIASITVLFTTNLCIGQFSLKKELDKNEYLVSGHQFEDQSKIACFNSETNEIKIYDSQFKLLSNIVLSGNETYNSITISYLSQFVFNKDERFEFLIQTVSTEGVITYKIMNDNGEVLMDNQEKYTFLIDTNEENLIVVRTTEYNSNIVPVKIKNSDKIFKTDGKYRKLRY